MSKQYVDIAEFGHSMHWLFYNMTIEMNHYDDFEDFARDWVDMHHRKSELQPFRNCERGKITERDKEVFALAIAMAQQLMNNKYRKHSFGSLDPMTDIFPV